jgi:hypothetical protein
MANRSFTPLRISAAGSNACCASSLERSEAKKAPAFDRRFIDRDLKIEDYGST